MRTHPLPLHKKEALGWSLFKYRENYNPRLHTFNSKSLQRLGSQWNERKFRSANLAAGISARRTPVSSRYEIKELTSRYRVLTVLNVTQLVKI